MTNEASRFPRPVMATGPRPSAASVERQTLEVGEARFAVPRLLVRESIDTMLGLVGMDVLGGTVLAVAAEHGRPVWWLIPPDNV